jgi:hypothetical protein
MKQLYARWSDQIHFLDVIVRQAHPGPNAPVYHTFEQKLADARQYVEEERIPWVLLVDDLEGTAHRQYGGLADPTYLIDADGRVSYYNMWTYAPALHQAIEALLDQGGRGEVLGGINRGLHMHPALTDGWRGLRKGLPQSYLEMELATPGSASMVGLGYLMGPLVAPLTLRSRPLATSTKVGLAAGAAGLLAYAAYRLLRSPRGAEQ